MSQAVGVAAVVAYLFSVFGWGSLVARWSMGTASAAQTRPTSNPALTVAYGLAALILIGGILNLARVAYAITLDILLVAGWILLAVEIHRARRDREPVAAPYPILIVALLAVTLIFLSVTLLPSRTINIFDDFFLYMVSPVRALQTGSLAGNPFESGGATTLGAQSFLQSFIVAHFELDYLPAFDNVFCLLLTLGLVIELVRDAKLPTILQLLCATAALAFNPQIVNTTAVYSASALMLALVLAAQMARRIEDRLMRRRAMIVVGLVGGAAICLKNTYALHVAIFCSCVLFCNALVDRNWKRMIRDVLTVMTGGAILLIPWALTYVGDYDILWALYQVRGDIAPADELAMKSYRSLSSLLSGEAAFFGGELMIGYGIIIGVVVVCAVVAFSQLLRKKGEPSVSASMIGLAAGYVLTFAVMMPLFDLDTLLRYTMPMAMSACIGAAIFIARVVLTSAPRSSASIGLGTILPLGLIALFMGTLIDRIGWARHQHTLLAFASGRNAPVMPYLNATMSHAYDSWIGGIQKRIPERAGILTWHPFAYLMDFRRNPILTLNTGSVHNPLFALPAQGDFERTTDLLRDIGVRYVMWEHTGLQHITETRQNWPNNVNSRYALFRKQAQTMLRMDAYMRHLGQRGAPFFADARIVVYDLGAP